jgi:hypothetical protein
MSIASAQALAKHIFAKHAEPPTKTEERLDRFKLAKFLILAILK